MGSRKKPSAAARFKINNIVWEINHWGKTEK